MGWKKPCEALTFIGLVGLSGLSSAAAIGLLIPFFAGQLNFLRHDEHIEKKLRHEVMCFSDVTTIDILQTVLVRMSPPVAKYPNLVRPIFDVFG